MRRVRVHFIGLHALQAQPILGAVLDRSVAAPSARTCVVSAVAAALLVLVGTTRALAIGGRR